MTQDEMRAFVKFLEDNDLFDPIPGGLLSYKKKDEKPDRGGGTGPY